VAFRIGFGYDVHRLAEGRQLYIGGVNVPHSKGALGHSDADVLIHAICDALLGAAALKDIGYHFPDNDSAYKNIDSKILLQKTIAIIQNEGFGINNIDCTVCLQTPKIAPYIEEMRTVLANLMMIPIEDVSVKATTTEKLGFVGAQEGISAYAVVLITK